MEIVPSPSVPRSMKWTQFLANRNKQIQPLTWPEYGTLMPQFLLVKQRLIVVWCCKPLFDQRPRPANTVRSCPTFSRSSSIRFTPELFEVSIVNLRLPRVLDHDGVCLVNARGNRKGPRCPSRSINSTASRSYRLDSAHRAGSVRDEKRRRHWPFVCP